MTADWLRAAVHDVRLALRLLPQRPGFAAVLLVTLALGIGAPTAIFSVVHAVLLRPLPYPEADRVVQFRIESRGPGGSATFDAIPASFAIDWGLNTTTLSAISVFNDRALTLSTPDGPFRLTGVSVTPNVFELLGVAPLSGRSFEPTTTDVRQVMLSHQTWQQFFGGSTAVIGSSVTFDEEPYRVVGVMPQQFQFPSSETAFWVPLHLVPGEGRGMLLPAIARLRPEATIPAMLEEGRTLMADSGDSRHETTLLADTLQEQLVGGTRRLLWVLMGAVSLVSVIATANIALLLLVRGATRTREFSIRLAIGAGRRQLVRQLFVEAITLAALGGTAGIVLASGMLQLLVQLAPPDIPRLQGAGLNLQVLSFAIALTVGTSLIFGVLSAGRTITFDPVRALNASGNESRLVSDGSPRLRLHVLAAAELTLTLVLLVGAGLLIRSLMALVLIDHGFNSDGAMALQVSMPAARYPTPRDRMAFHERLLERIQATKDVSSAGLAITMPNRQPSARFAYDPGGIPTLNDPLKFHVAEVRSVTDGFFEAMGIPLRAGRTFQREDRDGSDPVMVISESLARLHFPNKDPIGQLLYSGSGTRRVIGIVGDVRPAAPRPQLSPAAYLPIRQDLGVFRWFASLHVVVRGNNLSQLRSSMRALVLSLDPEMPPFNVRTLDEEVSRLVAGPRFTAFVLAAFAGVALVLAAVGVYGVMAYSAGHRTREIGVRMALGATRLQVLWLVMRDGVLVITGGLFAGLIAALWLAQTLTGLLYEVQPADPVALGFVALILLTVGLVAAYVPARRATVVSAVDALRAD